MRVSRSAQLSYLSIHLLQAIRVLFYGICLGGFLLCTYAVFTQYGQTVRLRGSNMKTAIVFQGPPAAASLAQSIILAQLIVLRRLDAMRAAMWTAPIAGVSLFLPSLLLIG